MAYSVNKSNGDEIIVEDGTINTETSLYLIGKNFAGYGEYIAEDLVFLLENFASATAPLNPTAGQIWYDVSGTQPIFRYWDGVKWSSMGTETIGPLEILDSTSSIQVVTGIYDEGELIGVISGQTFDISSADPHYESFNDLTGGTYHIEAGMTLKEGMKFHGTATSAQYADLAEMYKADKMYSPGTVIKIGGTEEVTQTVSPYDGQVFGIVSTDPAYLMNSGCPGVAVALEGRVPCKVIGKVNKGDRLVSSDIPGVAMVAESDKVTWQNQVGRAIENKSFEEVGLVEVVVGAK